MDGVSSTEIALMFAVGTGAILLLVTAIVLFVVFYQKKMLQEQIHRQELETAYQRKMLLATLESQENERSRISKELHDGVGVMIQSVLTNVQALGDRVEADVRHDITEAVTHTHQTLREIAFDLMPASLERFGLIHALKELCTRLGKRGSVRLVYTGDDSLSDVSGEQQVLLYRIAQEAVNNAWRHSQATEITVEVSQSQGQLTLRVSDNGRGIPPEVQKQSSGLGLFNLRTRAEVLGATLEFTHLQPSGTGVHVQLATHG